MRVKTYSPINAQIIKKNISNAGAGISKSILAKIVRGAYSIALGKSYPPIKNAGIPLNMRDDHMAACPVAAL